MRTAAQEAGGGGDGGALAALTPSLAAQLPATSPAGERARRARAERGEPEPAAGDCGFCARGYGHVFASIEECMAAGAQAASPSAGRSIARSSYARLGDGDAILAAAAAGGPRPAGGGGGGGNKTEAPAGAGGLVRQAAAVTAAACPWPIGPPTAGDGVARSGCPVRARRGAARACRLRPPAQLRLPPLIPPTHPLTATPLTPPPKV